MKDIIDQCKRIILNQYKIYESKYNIVDRDFYTSNELYESVRNGIDVLSDIFGYPKLDEFNFNKLFIQALKDFKHTQVTYMEPSSSLSKNEKETWLTDERKEKIGWNADTYTYRTRYIKYLENIGRSEDVIESTKNSSLSIIEKIGDPESNFSFFVRGMVVGNVQSGKTANFNAVINSAIDVGYKLIIVLSGIMEDLRRQTQFRIEKEVVGDFISSNKFNGVGSIQSFGTLGNNKSQIQILTSIGNDFNKSMLGANFSLNNLNILVCKKNTSVLQNLVLWLNETLINDEDKHDIPFIIIDDEADNASLNNLGHKGKDYATKINGHIRALLALFKKKTYIGYTATPFANLLQDVNEKSENKWKIRETSSNTILEFDQVDNLFPHDFIELLNPPSNYIGAKHFFETKIHDVKKIDFLIAPLVTDHIASFPIRVLNDTKIPVLNFTNKNEFDIYVRENMSYLDFESYNDYRSRTRASKMDDDFPQILPKSLEEAIKCFILSIAVRLSRKAEMLDSNYYQQHNTMLIHISRFTKWQVQTKKKVNEYLDKLIERINSDSLNKFDSIFIEFERLWVKYFQNAVNNLSDFLPNGYNDEYLTKKTFLEIRSYIHEAIIDLEVKAVNTLSKDEVDYTKGPKKYIVIGGNKLSRGYTLEGLSINYFIRTTNYADALLQMGRWFGYRQGYLDCCKLFITEDTFDKYNLCTSTIEELEEEFKRMSKLRKTPSEYATKVLSHPGVIQITRSSILKNSKEVRWSYSDTLLQTTEFKIESNKILNSWNAFKKFYSDNKNDFKISDKGKYLILTTNADKLIELLKIDYSFETDLTPFVKFLELANSLGYLNKWTIAIKTTGNGRTLSKIESGFNLDIDLVERSIPTDKNNYYYKKLVNSKIFRVSGSSSNIVTAGKDLSVGLDIDRIQKAENAYSINKATSSNKSNWNYPEHVYRRQYSNNEGVAVIYLMDLHKIVFNEDVKNALSMNEDILNVPLHGIAIGIPELNDEVGGTYLLNKKIEENILKAESIDEDETDEEKELDSEFDLTISSFE